MAASIAGVFWRAARPSELVYRHTSISTSGIMLDSLTQNMLGETRFFSLAYATRANAIDARNPTEYLHKHTQNTHPYVHSGFARHAGGTATPRVNESMSSPRVRPRASKTWPTCWKSAGLFVGKGRDPAKSSHE